ncbi:HAD family hydrolase [Nocardia sp. NPDC057227]|uniref:HAD family hydrolase n=1 Tax=Nocardia sp. NPDC057227 TaxID=3346056 RepID=UPI00363E9B8B
MVFDCDGLLVDTEARWSVAEAALFARHGFDFGPEQKAMLIGRTVPAAVAELTTYFGRPGEHEQLTAELMALVRRELDAGAEALPGARRIVAECAARVPVAVASNSPRVLVVSALARAGLAELLPVVVTADDVTRGKPDPALYLTACAKLGADPGSSVAFEDSGTGAAAARAAGMYLITVPSLPGKEVDHDWLLATLDDRALLTWARTLG